MLVEKQLQGHEEQSKSKVSTTTYTPCSAPSLGLTKPTTFRMPPPASKRPTASRVSATPKTPPARPSDSGKNSLQVPTKSSSSVASMGHTSGIQCHRCHGIGHVQKDCPSQRAYIATEDGYIRTSDIEDEEDQDADEEDGEVLGDEATTSYRSIIVQRVLSSQV